jgi:hypothetical protein
VLRATHALRLDSSGEPVVLAPAALGPPVACAAAPTAPAAPAPVAAPAAGGVGGEPSRVIVLSNMIEAADVEAAEDYEDIVADVRETCASLGGGAVASLVVSCIVCTVTFYANHAHNLTRSP